MMEEKLKKEPRKTLTEAAAKALLADPEFLESCQRLLIDVDDYLTDVSRDNPLGTPSARFVEWHWELRELWRLLAAMVDLV